MLHKIITFALSTTLATSLISNSLAAGTAKNWCKLAETNTEIGNTIALHTNRTLYLVWSEHSGPPDATGDRYRSFWVCTSADFNNIHLPPASHGKTAGEYNYKRIWSPMTIKIRIWQGKTSSITTYHLRQGTSSQ